MQYIPHKYQQEFHKSNARFRTFIAGRRGGKTFAGTVEALWWADKYPGSIGWIVAPTYVMLRDTNIPSVLELLPEWALKSWNKNESRIVLQNGSQIVFRTAEDPQKLRGVGLDWIWLDEASFMKAGVWDVLYPTLTDRGGVLWATTTPQGYDWVYRKLYKPAVDGEEDFAAWQFRTIDNPYIDPQMVEQARRDMNDQMFRQEYLATFEKFTGLVYPDFETDTHVSEFDVNNLQAPLWFIAIDVGYTNPTAIILGVEDAGHHLYIHSEWYESHKTVPEVAKQVKEMAKGRDIQAYIIDPASKGTHQTSEMSVMSQFHENGIPVVSGDNNVSAGINRVTQLLRLKALTIHPRCINVIEEFERYSWKESKDEEGNRYEKPIKAHDHLMDALRYFAMSRPDWFGRDKTDIYGVRVKDEYVEDEDPHLVDI